MRRSGREHRSLQWRQSPKCSFRLSPVPLAQHRLLASLWLPGGDLRHYAAVQFVFLHLSSNHGGNYLSSVLHHCGRGLIAGAFDSQYKHFRVPFLSLSGLRPPWGTYKSFYESRHSQIPEIGYSFTAASLEGRTSREIKFPPILFASAIRAAVILRPTPCLRCSRSTAILSIKQSPEGVCIPP